MCSRCDWSDGVCTFVVGSGGGTGVTTYAENIGVMAMTRIYSTFVFIIAAVFRPRASRRRSEERRVGNNRLAVFGGLAIVLFGLIAATGGRIWVQNGVDF